ncbi:enoyl-CoA hydratase/isomerase family protein [Thioclava indica]|uniref:3-hydroxyacyl-CoA dehydrogenase C-terminal domain-containing protein n=1 Tax=Thioclava indica TaxID=1353528 RepID=A0A074K0A5_9RHOB|nr:enoyl-CoA hydratase/isomerase family protein [Thioclava indica]KEO61605.1 hypothetical protein DT23_01145 [Thioclava indica]
MARRVKIAQQDGLAWITLAALNDQGAVAGFEPDLRVALHNALELALSDRSVRAIVLKGGAAGWPCAPDPLSDYAHDPSAPDLGALCGALAGARVPVLVSLSGRIQGGALAISQAASLRIATEDTCFCAPEFSLGTLPAAGGFVRLARRAGGAAALHLIAPPGRIEAERALALGLCDIVLPEVAPAQVIAALDALIAEGGAMPDSALADPATYLAALAGPKAELSQGPLAEVGQRACEVVEAAVLLPREEALDFEAVAYDDLSATPLAKALRHARASEIAARDLPGPPSDAGPAPTRRIGLWDQPAGFAGALLAAGHEVVFGASDAKQIQTAFSTIARAQEIAVQNGTLDPDQREADWARLGAATDPSGLGDCALLIARSGVTGLPVADLCVFESPDHLDPPETGIALTREGGVVELVAGPGCARATLDDLAMVLRQGGAQVILGGPGAAGIVAHLRLSLIAACGRALLAGASRDQVDRSLATAGFARSPLRLIDAIGAKTLNGARAKAGLAPDLLLVAMEDADLQLYASDGGAPDWLDTLRIEAGGVTRRLSDADILARVLAEMANSGAWLLQHAQAHRASDIDLAAIFALGLPKNLGGVMFAADQAGLITTRKRLRSLHEEGANAPVTLWDVLIRNGKHFADLDGH